MSRQYLEDLVNLGIQVRLEHLVILRQFHLEHLEYLVVQFHRDLEHLVSLGSLEDLVNLEDLGIHQNLFRLVLGNLGNLEHPVVQHHPVHPVRQVDLNHHQHLVYLVGHYHLEHLEHPVFLGIRQIPFHLYLVNLEHLELLYQMHLVNHQIR